MPTVSVLLPVYNAERYLRAAVESVVDQSFSNLELLALDDGSTDQSLAILKNFAAIDGRVRVISRENRGVVASLNELITHARGQYLARMDADDICRPRRFEKQIAFLEAHPDHVAVGSGCLFVDSEGMPIREFLNVTTHEEIDSAHMSGTSVTLIAHPSVMMRRDAVVEAGLYREEYRHAEDMDLFLRLAEIGKLANLSDVLLDYRQHLSSVCYLHGGEQQASARRAVRAAWQRRKRQAPFEIHEPDVEIKPSSDVHRKWAWWALSAGHRATARKHALKAARKDPLNIENLRVLVCSVRGY